MNNIISIITPSLNQGQFIEQTIKSVLFQAGNFYIDYIIVDGGSIDNSIDIIKKYDLLIKNNKYSIKCYGIKFRWFSKKDKGQTNALNKGFKMANGDICAWINSDDWYEKDVFQFIIKKFEENLEIDLIYGNCFEVYENGKIKKGEAIQGNFKKNLEEGCLISQPATFFRKKVLEKVGYLDESFNYCMDYDLWMKIMKNGKSLYFDKDLAYFRIWEESKTYNYMNKFIEEENAIRKKYGGSKINPGSIHRMRKKIWFLNFIKKKFPKLYKINKKIIYNLINIVKNNKI